MITWLNDRQSLGIRPGLERMNSLLDLLGKPQDSYRTVHVAGSNGKGSVAALLARTLQLSGHRTGLYTSPHLVEFAERIEVDGQTISTDDLSPLLEEMRTTVTPLDHVGSPPTFFEVTTAAALTHFATEGVGWAVVEAGMGGGGDATNVIHPELTVITNVSLEHTAHLGYDARSIARKKAGIIEPGVPLVTAATGDALEVLEKEAANRGSPIVVIGKDYRFKSADGVLLINGPNGERGYKVGMAGAHQLENAAVAVAGSDALRKRGVDITDVAIEKALQSTSLRGRLETFHHDGVRVTIDGAHNPAAAKSLRDSLENSGKFDLIVGFNADKDWPAILQHLLALARRVWAVPVRSPRSLDPHRVADHVGDHMKFSVRDSFESAYQQGRAAGATDILVAGSLFLAGEARAVITGHDLSEVGGSQ